MLNLCLDPFFDTLIMEQVMARCFSHFLVTSELFKAYAATILLVSILDLSIFYMLQAKLDQTHSALNKLFFLLFLVKPVLLRIFSMRPSETALPFHFAHNN